MKKDDLMFLYHMNESVNLIMEFVKDIEYSDFSVNRMIQSAVIREIGIIGEAANRISNEFKNEHDDINWKKIVGMRNRLIHDYFGVNIKIVWETTQVRIPELGKLIKKIISEKD
ncbi:MAG: DUF86 domain-containing protein [Ignavibacteriae bacterium]|nr:MAG: DUF86 domain-containing protein [Ignavibacteriota bacterium]